MYLLRINGVELVAPSCGRGVMPDCRTKQPEIVFTELNFAAVTLFIIMFTVHIILVCLMAAPTPIVEVFLHRL